MAAFAFHIYLLHSIINIISCRAKLEQILQYMEKVTDHSATTPTIIIIIIGDLYSAHVLCSRRFTIIDLSI